MGFQVVLPIAVLTLGSGIMYPPLARGIADVNMLTVSVMQNSLSSSL
jgi:hypothetical protein